MTIGETIRYFRERRQVKQYTLASKLNVSQSLVARWETGSWTPDRAQLNAIAAAFGERAGIFEDGVARDEFKTELVEVIE